MPTTRRPKTGQDGVAAADRALAVLSAFRKGDRELSLAELAERTGLVKSTIMRLAATLEERGYLSRTSSGTYRLDAELLRLGSLYRDSFGLEDLVPPVLEALVARTGETAAFYVRRADQRICLFRVESHHLLRMHVRTGEALPMDASATAQVLRTFGTRPLPAYALSLDVPIYTAGAVDPHNASLAMPVFGPGDALAGALIISGLAVRLTPMQADAARGVLHDAADELTRSLGGESPLSRR